MSFVSVFLFSLLFIFNAAAAQRPVATDIDVSYGKHERNKMDFWKAKSSKPTPVLVYFHGGGFKKGDKTNIHKHTNINDYLKDGVSCISVNYPFLKHTNNDYLAIMKHCRDAIDYIKKNATKWNIDPKKIGVSGISAGALITVWLGYSTKDICAMAVYLQPMGTEYFITHHVKKGDFFILHHIKKSAPPLMIYQASPESDDTHHPRYAKMLKKACDKKKATCELFGSNKNDIQELPSGRDHKKAMKLFFFKHWEIEILSGIR